MARQKFTNLVSVLVVHTDYDNCHMQPNQIVLNEVKDNYYYQRHCTEKNKLSGQFKTSHLCFKSFNKIINHFYLSIPNLYYHIYSTFLLYQTSTPRTAPMLSAFMPVHKVNYSYLVTL